MFRAIFLYLFFIMIGKNVGNIGKRTGIIVSRRCCTLKNYTKDWLFFIDSEFNKKLCFFFSANVFTVNKNTLIFLSHKRCGFIVWWYLIYRNLCSKFSITFSNIFFFNWDLLQFFHTIINIFSIETFTDFSIFQVGSIINWQNWIILIKCLLIPKLLLLSR